MLPRLPNRDDLLLWLNVANNVPAEFDLVSSDTEDVAVGKPSCPILLWLKHKYRLESVKADDWYTYIGKGYGVTLGLTADDGDRPAKLIAGLRRVSGELPPGPMTRDELIDILTNWENLDAALDRIKHARELAA